MFDNVRTKLKIRFTPFRTYERFQNETDQLVFHHPEAKEKEDSTYNGLTALEAAWNVTNAIQVRRASRFVAIFSSSLGNVSRQFALFGLSRRVLVAAGDGRRGLDLQLHRPDSHLVSVRAASVDGSADQSSLLVRRHRRARLGKTVRRADSLRRAKHRTADDL